MKINKARIFSLSHLLLAVFVAYSFSFLVTEFVGKNSFKIHESEFLINYLGIFLGLTIALISFILSITDKLYENVNSNLDYTEDKKNENKNKIKQIFKELKGDTFIIFCFFIIAVVLHLFENMDLPHIKWPVIFMKKKVFINQLKLTIFILSIYSIYDILSCLFNLSEAMGFSKN